MDLTQLPLFRKIGDIFRRSILLLHFSWISRIAQLLQVIILLILSLLRLFTHTSAMPHRADRREVRGTYTISFRPGPQLTRFPGRF